VQVHYGCRRCRFCRLPEAIASTPAPCCICNSTPGLRFRV
jgi:hypothetical protein